MHEMSLMQGVVDILKEAAAANGIGRIRQVHLVVGKMTNALPDAMQLAFQVLREDPLFDSAAELTIEERPVRLFCLTCQADYEAEEAFDPCPHCGSYGGIVRGGEELYVDSFEGE